MRKAFCILAAALAMTSCKPRYEIDGTADVQGLDGKMIYVKVVENDDLKSIDSCEVVHGKFQLKGNVDTASIALLFLGEDLVMPFVLEEGQLKASITDAKVNVTGTELNEKLFALVDKKNAIDDAVQNLQHKEGQMIMDGTDAETVESILNQEAQKLIMEEDELLVNFIVDNTDNVLAPGVFWLMTRDLQYPVMTPQIEDIMSKTSQYFKNHPYVKQYVSTAEENMKIINQNTTMSHDVVARQQNKNYNN